MNPDLDTLVTSLYVTVDDLLLDHPAWAPQRPGAGIDPKLADAELGDLGVIQALLGYTSEARLLRYAHTHLRPWFPYLPTRSAYDKRLRRSSGLMPHIINYLSRVSPSFSDDLWLVDSTPVECGDSRQTTRRSDLAAWATYGWCASHSRYFLGAPPPPGGHPIRSAHQLGAGPDQSRRTRHRPRPAVPRRPGPPGAGHHRGHRLSAGQLEATLNEAGITLIQPPTRTEKPRPHKRFLRLFRQIIESVNNTLETQLDLERHGGCTKPGVIARVLQRLLALTAAIWHNQTTNQPGPAHSLIAYDH